MAEEEHVQQADLNDLTYFWLPNGRLVSLPIEKTFVSRQKVLVFKYII